jgi:predicted RNA-binding protein with PUA-like domain
MKSEPKEFSIDDLRKRKRVHWDGVRNYEARNLLRDKFRVGDLVVFYHSNATPSGPAGIARVVRAGYPDFTQWRKTSAHFDPKATKDAPIWYMVDIAYVKAFNRVIPREVLREVPALRSMKLWVRPRLSITPLSRREFDTILKLGMKRE